jgi:hypothetical protein
MTLSDLIPGPNMNILVPGVGILLLGFAGLGGLYFGWQRLLEGEPLPAIGFGLVGILLLVGAFFFLRLAIRSLLY